jgi:hypothetical protein
VTLVELDLENASFTAHAPFSGSGDDGDEPEPPADESADSTDRAAVLPFLLGLTALVALAYLVRRRLNANEEPVTE